MKNHIEKIKEKIPQILEVISPKNIWAGASKKLRILIVAAISIILLIIISLTSLGIYKSSVSKTIVDNMINNLFITDLSYESVNGSLFDDSIVMHDVKVYPIDWRHKLGLSQKREDVEGLYLDIGEVVIPEIVYEDDIVKEIKIFFYDVEPSEIMFSRLSGKFSELWSEQGMGYTLDASINIKYYKKTESLDVNIDVNGGDSFALKIKSRFSDTYYSYKKLKDNLTKHFVGNSKIANVIGSDEVVGVKEIIGDVSINKIDIMLLDKNLTRSFLDVINNQEIDEGEFALSLRDMLNNSRDRYEAYGAYNAVKIIDLLIEMIMNDGTKMLLEIRPETSKGLYDLIEKFKDGRAMNPDTTGFAFKVIKNKINK